MFVTGVVDTVLLMDRVLVVMFITGVVETALVLLRVVVVSGLAGGGKVVEGVSIEDGKMVVLVVLSCWFVV